MSYSRMEARDATPSRRLPGSWLVRAVGVVVWAIINAAILFAEQLAELLAPLLLLAGFCVVGGAAGARLGEAGRPGRRHARAGAAATCRWNCSSMATTTRRTG